jgi:hypothetical protein
MQTQAGNERATKVPTDGWCWLRIDDQDRHIRQYWHLGKMIAVVSATRSPSADRYWKVLVIWEHGKPALGNHEFEVASEAAALQLMDAVAIGIHAVIVATGDGLTCLNQASADVEK